MAIAEILSTVRNFVSSSSKTNNEFRNESGKNNRNISSAIRDISKMFQSQKAENAENQNSINEVLDTTQATSRKTIDNNDLLKQSISLQNEMLDQLKQISSSVSALMQSSGGKNPLDLIAGAAAMGIGGASMASFFNNSFAGGQNVFTEDMFSESTTDTNEFEGGGGGESNSYNGLGSLSAKYESSSAGSSAIGYDSTGGTSYGKYQISSKQGTMDDFLEYVKEKDPEVYQRLSEAGPSNTGSRSGAMPDVWRQLAEENAFGDLEHDFIKMTHYDKAMDKIKDPDLKQMIEESPALQDVMWSTAVQHGPNNNIFNNAYKPGMSSEQLINEVYESRGTKFTSSTREVQESVKNRFVDERQQALEMLANPPTPTNTNSTNSVTPSEDAMGSSTSDIVVQQINHPDTGNGYTVEGAVDKSGRPVVFGSENAARAFGQMMIDSGGVVKGDDVASSQRSEEKNKSVGGVSGSKHLNGNALDIHGESGEWIRKNGSKYGWSPNDYPGTHGGHFEFGGQSQPNSEVTGESPGKIADDLVSDKTSSGEGLVEQTSADPISLVADTIQEASLGFGLPNEIEEPAPKKSAEVVMPQGNEREFDGSFRNNNNVGARDPRAGWAATAMSSYIVSDPDLGQLFRRRNNVRTA